MSLRHTIDIIVGRYPVTDSEINQFTPLRAASRPGPNLILHASISCKWTMRSNRAQNVRTAALNLILNRKGQTLHIVAVTAGPLPNVLTSLA